MMDGILKKTASCKIDSVKHEEGAAPCPELKTDHPSFSAAMAVTDGGIMNARNLTTDECSPLGPRIGR
ncbi:MAG: hypothetical protein JW743_01955 [Deltaproteobacteria bacterium]|nr:hypothetical protein [Deltaproteobacteria bacterium]MBN2845944.1 hypothetical protein [Deltaproteobacteria bacterium]